jgi:hypothetical protein
VAAMNRWSNYIKWHPSQYGGARGVYGSSLMPKSTTYPHTTWNGIALRNFTKTYDPSSSIIATCSIQYNLISTSSLDNTTRFTTMNFDLTLNTHYENTIGINADLWTDIWTHELGHALGIGSHWKNDYAACQPSQNFLNGNAVRNDGFNTKKCYQKTLEAYQSITNNLNYTKIPIEDSGGAGTAGVHWENNPRNSSYEGGDGLSHPGLQNEIMLGSIGSNMKISKLSIAALVDLGYEELNNGNSETSTSWTNTISASSLSLSDSTKLENCCSNCHPPKLVGEFVSNGVKYMQFLTK